MRAPIASSSWTVRPGSLMSITAPRCAAECSRSAAVLRLKVDADRKSSLSVRLMRERDIIAEDPVGLLTPRERECLRLVDQHLSSKQIARQLGMSKTSVDTYCDRARRKLGVEDRYAAAKLARRFAVNHFLTVS